MSAGAPAAATLSIFHHLFASVAEEMGLTLERTAYSPNIKERLDFSCALFLGDGRMLAQAAHIPVHLGAMPASVQAALAHAAPFAPGDVVILNDPYLGGTHLPDITLVSPVFAAGEPEPAFFVASRAHHADVGGMVPGSMPRATELYQEGLIVPPVKLVEAGRRNEALWRLILRNVRTPAERAGDLAAQLAAHTTGAARLEAIRSRYGLPEMKAQAAALIAYAREMTAAALRRCPPGRYTFRDYLDDDGQGEAPVPIQVTLAIGEGRLEADFAGTAGAVRGNLNAVPAIARSAVAYCVRCVALALLGSELPMNEGAFEPLRVTVPPGSLLDPPPPHAVAAGNVETSQRVVDVVFGALAQALPDLVPAASQGTMNNLSFGGVYNGEPFAYYETIGGGTGAGPQADGASGLHVHMSNTRNTPVEALEHALPVRVERYALRERSGGRGRHTGGEGIVRALRFLCPATVTLTGERRRRPPYGLQGGEPGACGADWLERNGERLALGGKATLEVEPGDVLTINTPGGGGWGQAGE
ncbi:MAG: hydantoinase B/oxoprolinase family protein [Chloroflexi bacterium]|jgi:N-methylhydantoinase B|nr:hydantoinase B/oxoprolinase family protein [Chloroflexota bacterium]